VRLLSASNALAFAALGRPDWATVYAATGKAVQSIQPVTWVIPDSGLVGLSQLRGSGDTDRTRHTVVCLLLLYLLIPGAAAVALLVANPWFVPAWVGPDLYAGDYVGGLLAVNLVIGSAVSGLFKVVSVVGHRTRIGVATLVYGTLSLGLGYGLGLLHGMAGLAEGAVLAGAGFAVPYGLRLLRRVHGVGPRELVANGFARWAVWAAGLGTAAVALGAVIGRTPVGVAATALAFLIGYTVVLRPVIAGAPWPARVRGWLLRLRLVPTGERLA
jgi:hypothetical protein